MIAEVAGEDRRPIAEFRADAAFALPRFHFGCGFAGQAEFAEKRRGMPWEDSFGPARGILSILPLFFAPPPERAISSQWPAFSERNAKGRSGENG